MSERVTGVGEECGVFGIYDLDGNSVAETIYFGLEALQHRGQDSCGIAVSDTQGPGKVLSHKGMGLLTEVFNSENMEKLTGNLGVGHVRYPTAGTSSIENAQPLVLNYVKGTLSLSLNGNLLNAHRLRDELSYKGAIFQTKGDAELIAYLIARERIETKSVEDAVVKACSQLSGAYSFIFYGSGFRPPCRRPWLPRPSSSSHARRPGPPSSSSVPCGRQ